MMKKFATLFVLCAFSILLLTTCTPIPLKLEIERIATLDPKWEFLQKIPAYESSTGDSFGCAVSVSESAAADYIIVGNEKYSTFGGRAYVYKLDRSATKDPWKYQDTLAPDTTGSSFGFSVDISGSQAVVGAYADASAGSTRGAVYIFEFESPNWTQKKKYTGAATGDRLGYSVALTTNTVVAGAPYFDSLYLNAGRVETFTRDATTWSVGPTILANDGDTSGSQFGSAVDIDATSLIVGSPAYTGAFSSEGKVYIFVKSVAWDPQSVPNLNLVLDNNYGQSVSIRGGNALAGTPTTSPIVGTYSNPSGSWKSSTLTAPGLGFGTSVGVASEYAVVGAPLENGNRGLAYMYRLSGSTWSQYGTTLSDSNAPADENFGCAVAISENYCVIGAKGSSAAGDGAVYVYKLIK